MDTQQESGSLSPPSSGPPPSPPAVQAITWAGALVAVAVTVAVSLAAPHAIEAYIHGTAEESARAARVLLCCAGTLLGVAAPTSFRDVLAVAKRVLPGGKS